MAELQFGQNKVIYGRYDTTQTQIIPLARLFLIGRTERGPVGIPTICADADGFAATFGEGSDLAGTSRLYQEAQAYKKAAGNDGDILVLRLNEGQGGTAVEPTPANAGDAPKLSFRAEGPGSFGNSIQRAVVHRLVNNVDSYDIYVQELRNGNVVRNRQSLNVKLTAADVAQANAELAGLAVGLFDPLAPGLVVGATEVGVPRSYVTLTGGLDSTALTLSTWTGAIDPLTQERSGLFNIRTTDYGGPVIIAEGAATAEVRALLYSFASDYAGIYLDGPASDILPGAALAEKQSLESLYGAESAYYVYPRGRDATGPSGKPRGPLGYIAGKVVSGVNNSYGKIIPPNGNLGLADVQRSPNGRDLLVHDQNQQSLNDKGVGTLVRRGSVIELQGMKMMIPDPRQPETDRLYERMAMMAYTYALGPVLGQFNKNYIDSRGAFFNVVKGKIRDTLKPYWASGVLYGNTVEESFSVKMDFELNPLSTLVKEGRAKIRVKVKNSPVAEGLDLAIFSIPLDAAF